MNSSQSPKNPLEKLYNTQLTEDQVAEMTFNLTDYIEMLAEMDRQRKERQDNEDNRGSDKATETIK